MVEQELFHAIETLLTRTGGAWTQLTESSYSVIIEFEKKVMENRPVYPISIVSELHNVHPETIRVWERHGLVHPQRRNGKRFYSDNDLKRLRFIQKLIAEGLNLSAISHFLRLYPCWHREGCPLCMHRSERIGCARPCWKDEGTYCQVSVNEDMCVNCEFRTQEVQCEPTATNYKP